jgi:6,7-dimethyl-8-ribityllumazine synthase
MKVEGRNSSGPPLKAHVLIVEARFYGDLLDEMGAGAREVLEEAGASHETVVVPGSLEVPGAIAVAEATGRFDGYVALGVVIRGETTHYDIVAGESARGLMDLTLRGLAIGNGILTVDNEAQAWARARRTEMNKGGGAAAAALAMIRLKRQLEGASVHGRS